MKKFKGWLALMLAVVLVSSNAIYSMGSTLQANEMEQSAQAIQEEEPEVAEEVQTNTEGVDVSLVGQQPAQSESVVAEPVAAEQVAPTEAPAEEPAPEVLEAVEKTVTFVIEGEPNGTVTTQLDNQLVTNGMAKVTSDAGVELIVAPHEGYAAEVHKGETKIELENGVYSVILEGDATITIKFTKKHSVKFIDWDGTVLTTQEVKNGESAVVPDAPNRGGHKFTGWTGDYSIVTSDMEITAAYQVLQKYIATVHYAYDDGRVAANPYIAEVEEGANFAYTIQLPNIDGYEAKKDGVVITEYLINIENMAEDVTDTIYYERIKIATSYKVIHRYENLDGTTYREEEAVKPSESGNTVEEAAVEANGFTPDALKKNVYVKLDGTAEVTFTYARNSYFIVFETNGDLVAPMSAKYEKEVTLPTAVRKGYTFKGWTERERTEVLYQAGEKIAMPVNGKELIAVWEGANVKYTPVYWIQDPDNLDDYFYVSTIKDASTGKAGEVASINTELPKSVIKTLTTAYSMPDNSYELNTEKTAGKNPQLLEGDGSTIVNYYIDRVVRTLQFNPEASMQSVVQGSFVIDGITYTKAKPYSIEIRFGQDITTAWPMKWLTYNKDATNSSGKTFYAEGIQIGSFLYHADRSIIIDKNIWAHFDNLHGMKGAHVAYVFPMTLRLKVYTEVINGESGDHEINGKTYNLTEDVRKTSDTSKNWFPVENAGFKPKHLNPEITEDESNHKYVDIYYNRKSYNLQLNSQGKEEVTKYQYEAPIKKLANPTNGKVGYTFAGWYTSEYFYEGTEFDVDTLATMPGHNIVLYAKWVEPTYTVTTDADNGTTTVEQLVLQGKKAVRPSNPVNGVAEFLGWYVGDEPFSFDTQINKDITVKAKWKVSEYVDYTVTYVDNNGKELKEPTMGTGIHGSEVTVHAKNIDGWVFNKFEQSIILDRTELNQITFIYTMFLTQTYSVRYVEKDTATGIETELAQTKIVSDAKESKVIEYFKSISSYTPDAVQKTLYLSTDPEANVITFYYTKNQPKGYTIEHYQQKVSGDGYELVAADTDKTQAAPIGSTAAATAKTYDGFTYAQGISEASGTVESDKDLTLKLYYTRNKYAYTVHYLEKDTNKEVGTTVSNTAFYQSDVTVNALGIPGYKLLNGLADSNKITIGTDLAKNIHTFYYEKRSDLSYVVNYLNIENGESLKTAKSVPGQKLGEKLSETADKEIVKDEITYKLQGEESKDITISHVEKDNQITFYYKEKEYSVEYDANRGSGNVPVDTNTYKKDAVVKIGTSRGVSLVDATFIGWSADEFVRGKTFDTAPEVPICEPGKEYTMPAHDVTLYAVWAVDKNTDGEPDYDQWTITYNANGATGGVPTDTTLYGPGESITATAKDKGELVKDGHIFKGWKVGDTDLIVQKDNTFNIAGNTTLHAQWAQVFGVTYNSNGSMDTVTDEIKYEKDIEVLVKLGTGLKHASVDGKPVVFVGWAGSKIDNPLPDGSSDPQDMYGTTFKIQAETTLYAVWAIDENENGKPDYKDTHVTIRFAAGENGSINEDQTTEYNNVLTGVPYESRITVPGYKANEGYELDRWSPVLPNMKSDITETDPQMYTVTFKPQNYDFKVTYKYDEKDTKPAPTMQENIVRTQVFGSEYTITINKIDGYVYEVNDNKEYKMESEEIKGTMTIAGVDVTVTYHRDENGNGTPDCDEEKFDIIFKAGENGSINEGQTTKFNRILTGLDFYANVTVPEVTPEDAGYTFTGWSPALPEAGAKVSETVTYTAQFTANEYDLNVTYRVDDLHDSEVAPEGIPGNREDEKVVYKENYKIEVPIIGGFVAVVEYATDHKELEGPMPIGGVTAIVTYHKDENGNGTPDCKDWKYDVTFIAEDNGNFAEPMSEGKKIVFEKILEGLTFNSQVTVPTPVAEPGYKFSHWSPLDPPKEETATVNGDATYTAIFATAEYGLTVTYATDDASKIDDIPVNISEAKDFGAEYEVLVPDFDGYITNIKYQAGDSLTGTIPVGGVNIQVIYQRDENGNEIPDVDEKRYAITFTAGANGIINAGEATSFTDILTGLKFYDKVTKVPEVTADTGYSFDKWSPTLPVEGDTVTESVGYEAQFKINKYTLEVEYQAHEEDGAIEKLPTNYSDEITYNEKYQAIVPSMDGYVPVVDGKVVTGDVSGVMTELGAKVVVVYHPDKNGNGEPDCDEEHFTITFADGDHGSIDEGETKEFKDILTGLEFYKNVTEPKVTATEGYTFTGWDPVLPKADATVTGSVTYKAQYEINKYKLNVTYKVHDTDVVPGNMPEKVDTTVTYNDTYTIAKPDILGYVARVEYKSGPSVLEGKMPAKDIEVVITYHLDENGNGTPDCEDGKHDITFKAGENGAIAGADENGKVIIKDILDGLTFGEQVKVPTAKPDAGYHFAGWTPGLPEADALIKDNNIYTATFAPNIYQLSVTYETDDGSIIPEILDSYEKDFDFGTEYKVEAPDHDGYITKVTGKLTDKMPVDGATVEVLYQRDENGNEIPDAEEDRFDITFTAGENGRIKEGEKTAFEDILIGLDFYENVTVPAVTPDPGYEFAGWSPDIPKAGGKVEDNVEYAATFKAIEYDLKVTYDVHDYEGTLEGKPDSYEEKIAYTDSYSISVPSIEGFAAVVKYVTGPDKLEGTMPIGGVEVVVTYHIDENGNGTPDGEEARVDVSFQAGPHGTISGADADGKVMIKEVLVEMEFGEVVSVPEATPEDGYRFVGWTPELPKDKDKIDAKNNYTYVAVFAPNEYGLTVTYRTDDNSIIEGMPGSYSEQREFDTDYAVEEPDFEGYIKKVTGSVTGKITVEGIVVEVLYQRDENGNNIPDVEEARYDITFEALANGSINEGQETVFINILTGLDFYSKVTVPEVTAADGYTFTGWSPALPEAGATVSETVTYVAQFTANVYTLKATYEVHDSQDRPVEIPTDRNEEIAFNVGYEMEVPTIEGYVVRVEYVTGPEQLEGTMPIGGVEIKVTYHRDENGNGTPDCEDDRFDITFTTGENGTIAGADENGKVVIEDILDGLTFGEQVTVPAATPDEGYHFVGWTPSLPGADAPVKDNQDYTAVFAPNSYDISVTYKTDDGSVITEMPTDYTQSKDFGTDYTVEVPNFEGYITKITGEIEGIVPVGGVVVEVLYQRDENGNNIPDIEEERFDIRFTAGANGIMNENQKVDFTDILTGLDFYSKVTVPEVTADKGYSFAGFSPVLPNEGDKVTGSVVYEAQFTKNVYTVTVDYVTPEGETSIPGHEEEVAFGDEYTVATPSIPGYTPNQTVVSGTMTDEDVKVVISYEPNTYQLIVNYVDEAGNILAPQHTEDVVYKLPYSVASPAIAGYATDQTTVAGNMAIDGVIVNVVYAVSQVTPVPPVTPTPTTPTTPDAVTPVTPATPAAVTPAAVTPAAVTPATVLQTIFEPIITLAETVTEAVGAQLQEVLQSEDEGVPLANRNVDQHRCCILHFLILLLALFVEILYTRSMKKRQRRIFELREELARVELGMEKEDVA